MTREPADSWHEHDVRHWSDDRFQQHFDRLQGAHRGPVVVVESTGSTNADVADQAAQGAPSGFTIVAHEQVSGRGRLDRQWVSPLGAGVAMSILVRPHVPVSRWGWLPLLAGLGVVAACADVGLSATLKWPNDVIVDQDGSDGRPGPRKCGGILVERVDDPADSHGAAAVIGIGLNVDLSIDELPTDVATSLRLEGVLVDRELVVVRILDRVMIAVDQWAASNGDVHASGVLAQYRDACSTLGQRVRVERPGGSLLTGIAIDIDQSGGLVVEVDDGDALIVTAGDVVHVRADRQL